MQNAAFVRKLPSAILAGLMWMALVAAGPVPAKQVRDDGRLFKADTVEQVNEIVRSIKQKYGWDLTVETFPEIPQRHLARFQAEPKETFFENWLRSEAHASHTRGVFVLLVAKPGRLQVGVGMETTAARAFTTKDRDELRDLMLKKLGGKEFDEALLAGAKFVARRMEANKANGANVAQPMEDAPHPADAPAAAPVTPPPASATPASTTPSPTTVPASAPAVASPVPSSGPSIAPVPASTGPSATPPAGESPSVKPPTEIPATAPATSPATTPSTVPSEPKSDFSAKPDESATPKSTAGSSGTGITDKPDTTAKPDANKTDVSPKPESGAKPAAGGVESNK